MAQQLTIYYLFYPKEAIHLTLQFPINDGDNNVGRIMRNVINAFIRDGALPGSGFIGDEKHWR